VPNGEAHRLAEVGAAIGMLGSDEQQTLARLAVFCGAADARSWAFSSMGPVASPSDPMFVQMVRQATFLMIPPRDDDWPDSAFF
jgi:hypothetical protein